MADVLRRLGALAGVLLAWEIVARLAGSFFVPPISAILTHAAGSFTAADPTRLFLSQDFTEHVLPSIARFLLGWLLAATAGVVAGLAIGWSSRLEAATDPLIRFGMAIPPPALLPFAIVLLGLGDEMKVFLIAFGSLWPVLLNTIDGVRSIDPLVLHTSRVLRLPRRRFVTSVLVPAASPQIMAGLRVSLGTALILMVIAELYASSAGIGFLIVQAQRSFRILDMWSGIVLLALAGLGFNSLFVAVERRVLRWHRV